MPDIDRRSHGDARAVTDGQRTRWHAARCTSGVPLGADTAVTFTPGGMHVMLVDLARAAGRRRDVRHHARIREGRSDHAAGCGCGERARDRRRRARRPPARPTRCPRRQRRRGDQPVEPERRRRRQHAASPARCVATSPTRAAGQPATRTNAARSHGDRAQARTAAAMPHTVATTGGTHQIRPRPGLGGERRVLQRSRPQLAAAAPTVNDRDPAAVAAVAQPRRARASTPITPPAIAGHGDGEATSVVTHGDLGRRSPSTVSGTTVGGSESPGVHVGWWLRRPSSGRGGRATPRHRRHRRPSSRVRRRVGLRRQLGDARAVPVVVRGRRVTVLVHDTVGVDPQVRLTGVALDLDVVAGSDLDPHEGVAALDRRRQRRRVVGRDRHDLAAPVARRGGVGERGRGRPHDDRPPPPRRAPGAGSLVAVRRLVIEQLLEVGGEVVDAHTERPRQHDLTGVVDGVQQGRVGDLDRTVSSRCARRTRPRTPSRASRGRRRRRCRARGRRERSS